jgi:hypothetical protein
MNKKDMIEIKEKLSGITLIQMRDPEFSASLTELYVLVGDLITIVKRPHSTFQLLKTDVKARSAHRERKLRNNGDLQ